MSRKKLTVRFEELTPELQAAVLRGEKLIWAKLPEPKMVAMLLPCAVCGERVETLFDGKCQRCVS